MTGQEKSVVSFLIDDTTSADKASKAFHDDYKLNFKDFLEYSAAESDVEDFSYSNQAVKKAGRRLRKKQGDLKSATTIIQKFRAAHEKPLNTIAYLIERCCRDLSLNVKPVTRLKRLETIVDKLQRKSLDGHTNNATCVTNMNDIGGCRAIFSNLQSLEQVASQLKEVVAKVSRIRIKDVDNYIINPKKNDCGYRSLHVIFRYDHACGKSFNIEAQLRTRLQHLWATTAEIIDVLERTKIKTHSHNSNENKGKLQIKWEELLSIMSRYIADAEGAIKLNKVEKKHLSMRLNALNNEINALSKLKTFRILSKKVEACSHGATEHVLLMINDHSLKLIFSEEFDNYSQAISSYNAAEKMTRSDPRINTLLISTKNMGQLSEAYPNYLGDCSSFISLLKQAMRLTDN